MRGPINAWDGGTSRRGGPEEGSSASVYPRTLRFRSVFGGGSSSVWQSLGGFAHRSTSLCWLALPRSPTNEMLRSTGSMLTRYTEPLTVSTQAYAPETDVSLWSGTEGRMSATATSTGGVGRRMPGPIAPGRRTFAPVTGGQAAFRIGSSLAIVVKSRLVSHSVSLSGWAT